MNRLATAIATLLLTASLATGAALAAEAVKSHGLAMHGDLKYPANFRNFDYVNPAAPKSGDVRLIAIGSYDSFNGSIIKGQPVIALGLIYDSLMVHSLDEPFSEYCLLCETVEMPEDRSWVSFTLRPQAKWHDGVPITAEDVIWTFNTLREKGAPFYRYYYASVKKVEKTGDRTVKFTFEPGENRELPLIIGQLTVLPKHYWADKEFEATTLVPPLGSGAYKIDSFDAGRSITYTRVPDYWGARLAVNAGSNNFDKVRYDYYRDSTVAIEAFKSGAADYRAENSSRHWAVSYDIPAVKDGRLKKEEIPHKRSAGMQGFVFNMRRDIFKDPMVRRALAYGFDFEWSNKTLFYGQYARTLSFFQNSELAATGLPQGREREILAEYADRLPPEVFTKTYTLPVTNGSGKNREQLRYALTLLQQAGWDINKETRKLTHTETGEVMEFEILLVSPLFERIVLPFKKNMARLGIEITVRTVDSAQYQQRTENFDYDMIVSGWGQSMSPGNEQRNYWGSEVADRQGSRNLSGIKDPVVDELIELLIAAPTREELVQRTRALDRVLQWNHIVIPHWHTPYDRVLSWDKFSRPAVTPERGVNLFNWWIDPAKEKALEAKGRGQK
ncbi:MAG: ABC transporter substrate-binding protein [Proteobacteria bacterium]|nr:ABC transporter substrate-binding protein [Pseudomonadota bacterium]